MQDMTLYAGYRKRRFAPIIEASEEEDGPLLLHQNDHHIPEDSEDEWLSSLRGWEQAPQLEEWDYLAFVDAHEDFYIDAQEDWDEEMSYGDDGSDYNAQDVHEAGLDWDEVVLVGTPHINQKKAARGKSTDFYMQHLDDDVYEGAGQSLRQWLCTRVAEKIDHNSTDTQFESQLHREYQEAAHFQKKQCVYMPTSLHLIRRILGVQELWELDYHVCACEDHFWAPLSPKKWIHPDSQESTGPDHECPVCEGKRFVCSRQPNGRQVVQPYLVRNSASSCFVSKTMLHDMSFFALLCRGATTLVFLRASYNQTLLTQSLQARYEECSKHGLYYPLQCTTLIVRLGMITKL
jgi:hypothetical protein